MEKELFPAYISALATSEESSYYTLLGKRTSKNPKKRFKADLPFFVQKALSKVATTTGTTQEELDTQLFKQMSNAQRNKYHKERTAQNKKKTADESQFID